MIDTSHLILNKSKAILFLYFATLFLISNHAYAGNKNLLTYAGRIVLASGQPEQSTTVIFTFQILAPTGCVLWQETSSAVNMAGSSGAFSTQIGGGTNSAAGGLGWAQVFQNGVAIGGGGLTGTGCTGTYTGAATDDRTMYVTVNDASGSGNQVVGPISVKSVAQNAMFAGYPVVGAPSDTQTLVFSSALQAWQPGTGGGGGGVSSVTGTSPISVTNGTTTPAIAIAAATSTTAGYLSAADWNTFNGKLGAIAGSSLSSTQFWIGNSSNLATTVSMSGDGTMSNTGVLALKSVGTAGTYGSATQVPVLTTDAQGRVTGVTNTSITVSGSPSGSAGGDLTGNYPNPTLAAVGTAGTYTKVTVDSKGRVSGHSNLNISDIQSSVSGNWFTATGACSSGQTLTYSSVTDTLSCQAYTFSPTQLVTPTIYGSTSNSGTLTLAGTSATTPGNVIVNPNGGSVGIWTSSPSGILDIEGGTSASGDGSGVTVVAQNGYQTGGSYSGGNITLTGGNNFVYGTGGNVTLTSGGSYPNTTAGASLTLSGTHYLASASLVLQGGPTNDGSGAGGVLSMLSSGSPTGPDVTLVGGAAGSLSFNGGNVQIDGGTGGPAGNVLLASNRGSVGIGTASPQTTLQVAGVISPATDNTYSLGSGTYRFVNIYATGSIVSTSDARQKTDVVGTDLGLDFINKLRPVTYHWISGDDHDAHYGLIAQETEQVIRDSHSLSAGENPPIVDHDAKTDRYGIKYTELIAPLIKAAQQLSGQVQSCQALQSDQQRALASVLEDNAKLKKENAEIQLRLQRIEDLLNQK